MSLYFPIHKLSFPLQFAPPLTVSLPFISLPSTRPPIHVSCSSSLPLLYLLLFSPFSLTAFHAALYLYLYSLILPPFYPSLNLGYFSLLPFPSSPFITHSPYSSVLPLHSSTSPLLFFFYYTPPTPLSSSSTSTSCSSPLLHSTNSSSSFLFHISLCHLPFVFHSRPTLSPFHPSPPLRPLRPALAVLIRRASSGLVWVLQGLMCCVMPRSRGCLVFPPVSRRQFVTAF